MANICLFLRFIATTEGSLIIIPLPRTYTKVLAVPKSIPMSEEKTPKILLTTTYYLPIPLGGLPEEQKITHSNTIVHYYLQTVSHQFLTVYHKHS